MDKNNQIIKQFVRKKIDHKRGIPKNYETKESIEFFEKIEKIDKKKTSRDINFINRTLRSHFVFYALSDNDL